MPSIEGEKGAGMVGLGDLSFLCPHPQVHRELNRCRGIWEGSDCAVWSSSTSSSFLTFVLLFFLFRSVGEAGIVRYQNHVVYTRIFPPIPKLQLGLCPHFPSAGKARVIEIQNTTLVCQWEHGGRIWKEYPSHGGTSSSNRMEKHLRGRKPLVIASFQRVSA